jgi:membrane protein implicated in regulation of membrane protease activity
MEQYMVVIWFVVVIVAALIEINTMDLTSIWFSVGALFAFVIAIVEKEAIPLQFIAFLVVTGGLLLAVRPIARNYLKTNVINTNADRLIGKVAVCTKMINVGERGEVKIDGKFWLAVTSATEEIELDEKVVVLAIEGVKLIVDKLE